MTFCSLHLEPWRNRRLTMQLYSIRKGRILRERPTAQRLFVSGRPRAFTPYFKNNLKNIKKQTIERKTGSLRWPSGGFERARVIKTKAPGFFLVSSLFLQVSDCSCHLPSALLSAKDLLLLYQVPREELCCACSHGMHSCSLHASCFSSSAFAVFSRMDAY